MFDESMVAPGLARAVKRWKDQWNRRREACVPPGTRIYAIGDSHGCFAAMRLLHAKILEDCAGAGARRAPRGGIHRLVAVYLGDYVDRGPHSRELVDLLIHDPLPGFESVFLMGNHEAFLLDFLEHDADPLPWLLNGGTATLESYGLDPLESRSGAEALRAALASRVPAEHLKFFKSLHLTHMEGDYLFVHAGVRPGVSLARQQVDDLLWIREPFLNSTADHGAVIVHGHTPEDSPVERVNRIGIDTGACYGGALTALVLEGSTRRYLRVASDVPGAKR